MYFPRKIKENYQLFEIKLFKVEIIHDLKMGKRSVLLLLLMFFLGGSFFLRAQPNTLYFMKGIPQTKDLNPARPGITTGFYFSMPLFSKLDLAANTNNWAYNDLIHWRTINSLNNNPLGNSINISTDSLVLDLDKFQGKLGNKNFAYESAALTVLEGGYKKGKNFYAASITEREFTQVFFSKNLVSLLKYGDYPYVGDTYYSGNFGVGAQHYREFAFNYSHDVNKKLTIGGAAKILFGMATVQTNGMNIKATSPANGEYLDITATGRVNISAPVDFTYNSKGEIKTVNSLPNYSVSNYLSNLKNPGIAFDFGFAYRVNKKTELSASIIDLGMIGWKSNVTRLTEHGQFLYKGINLNDPTVNPPIISKLTPIINQLSDSISAAFRPDTTGTSFSTLLPAKIYFGIDYKLSDVVNLSGLSRIRIINNTIHTSLTASANALIGNGISLSASYSVMESTYDNLGLGVGIRLGVFQIYTATDNLFSPFYPSKARNMNLRIGINFIFDGTGKSGKGGSGFNQDCQCPN